MCMRRATVVRSGAAFTCNAAMGLLDMVEPQRRQVQHLPRLHAAAQRLSSAVLWVLLQVWVHRVQRNPRDLGGDDGSVSCTVFNKVNRRLNAPSQSLSDQPPQTPRHSVDGTRPAGTDLTDAQRVSMVTGGGVVYMDSHRVVALLTVGDEGSICGWQQDEVFLSRNHTVKILVVVLVH